MRIFNLLFVAFWLVGCARTPNPAPVVTPLPATPLPAVTPTPADHYEITASVNRPEPAPDEVVTVSGALIKNGVYLASIPMWAYWPEEGGAPGQNECVSQMAYQRGICAIYAKGYPVDVYVPVKIKITYDGMVFTTETGFTPRSK